MKFKSLEFKNMSFAYPAAAQAPEEFVFSAIDFNFPMEQDICFVGPVGAGKSTLMKILAGLDDPRSGSYCINGQKIGDLDEVERFPIRRAMGYGFSQGGLIQNSSLRENLALALGRAIELDGKKKSILIDEYLDFFSLQEVADLRPGSVSGGMRMACCLARAFIHQPEMVLLSHPSNGLNPKMQKSLFDLIKLHRKERGLRHLFMVSDNNELIEKLDCLQIIVGKEKLELA